MEINVISSGSKGNAYRISDGRTPILIEAGISFKKIKQAIGFSLSEINGVLLTHHHNDHSIACRDIMKAGVNLYTSQGTISALNLSGHRMQAIEPMKQFKIGTWTILPFPVEHDCEGSLGFLLQSGNEKLLFITDSAYVKYKFNNLTHVMIECNYITHILKANKNYPLPLKRRVIKTHFSLKNVLDFFQANDISKVQEIWLIHLSDSNSNAGEMKEAVQRATGKMVYVA